MDLFNTRALLGVVDALDRPPSFLLDLFFREQQTFDTEEVYLDKLERARRVAPYVSPLVAGKPERARGYKATSFKPAYVKPKHMVEPSRALKRAAGERIGGEMSPEARYNLAVVDNLAVEEDQITRREEVMASEILRTGKVIVTGEDYPTQLVDFERAAGQTIALTSTARWGESGVSVLGNLRTWGQLMASNSGANPRVLVVDPLAGELIQKDSEVRAILDNRRQHSGDLELSGMVSGAYGEEAVPIGTVGQWEIWQYQGLYTDAAGSESKIMPDYTVIMGAPTLAEGVRTYGAILDTKALRAFPRWPKYWETDDPSVGFTMTQSAPLPVLGRPNATLCATVR